jgi:hypothetical protein
MPAYLDVSGDAVHLYFLKNGDAMKALLRTLSIVAAGAALFPVAAGAVINAGFDLFRTDPNTTYQDFSATPIPPSFFDPGSDPFVGTVNFKGVPLGPVPWCGSPLHLTDTIVRRPLPANVTNVGDIDVIPIEVVALNLVSVQPITVTYNGGMNPEPWILQVYPSPTIPSQGQMQIMKTHPNGGTFDSVLRVYPMLVFTRVSDSAMRVIDGGQVGMFNDFQANGVPWSHTSCTWICEYCGSSNFIPGIDPLCNLVPFSEQAALAAHGVIPPCTGPVGAQERSWGAVKALYRE